MIDSGCTDLLLQLYGHSAGFLAVLLICVFFATVALLPVFFPSLLRCTQHLMGRPRGKLSRFTSSSGTQLDKRGGLLPIPLGRGLDFPPVT